MDTANMKKVLELLASLNEDTTTASPDAKLSTLVAQSGLSEAEVRVALNEAYVLDLCAKCPEGHSQVGDDLVPLDPVIRLHPAGEAWLKSNP